MERLPQDLEEEILQRLEIKSLVRLTSVCKRWNSMIKSRSFASRHQVRTQSRDPDILLGGALHHKSNPYPCLRTLESHSSFTKVNYIRKPSRRSLAITGSCDGLVCIYDFRKVIYVFNPATRWCRFLPRAKFQQINCIRENQNRKSIGFYLGFGKDIVTSKYKMVWLYNSEELDLDGQTTCEVFDFTSNTWRQVKGSPYRIYEQLKSIPFYINGSLHWFTVERYGKIKMIWFDLHTEVFQLMSEIPIATTWAHRLTMWSLNNRLCVSEMKNDGVQDIWSLNSHKVWEKIFSLNLNLGYTNSRTDGLRFPIIPLTIFNKTRLLFLYPPNKSPSLFVHDTTDIDSHLPKVILPSYLDQAVSFIPSLLTI